MKTASNPTGSRNIFAQRLRDIMEKSKTSQQKVADMVGISRQTIAQYADGSAVPTVERLFKISKFFHVSSDYLIGLIDMPSTNIAIRAIHDKLGLSAQAIQTLLLYKRAHEGEKILAIVNFLLEQQNPMPILKPPTDFDGDLDQYWYVTWEYFFEPGLEKREKGEYCPVFTKILQYLSLNISKDEELRITQAGTVGSDETIQKKDLHHWKDAYDITRIASSTLIENVLLMEINDMLRELKPKWPKDEEADNETDEEL